MDARDFAPVSTREIKVRPAETSTSSLGLPVKLLLHGKKLKNKIGSDTSSLQIFFLCWRAIPPIFISFFKYIYIYILLIFGLARGILSWLMGRKDSMISIVINIRQPVKKVISFFSRCTSPDVISFLQNFMHLVSRNSIFLEILSIILFSPKWLIG